MRRGRGGREGEHQLTTEQKIRAIPSDSNPIYQPAACRGILTVDVEVVDVLADGGMGDAIVRFPTNEGRFGVCQ